ncbi:MAG: hypothetical protein RIB45_10675 [Marivibrio sp.]|uniref:hypothetical protein n=1 Tax=Marivibrio sp. TaxID=2039719 RepID=UPI0032ED0521
MTWPIVWWGTGWKLEPMVLDTHGATLLGVLILWAAFHRKIARAARLWRRFDPGETVAMGDRRRAIFWRPAFAFILHMMAAMTDLIWITGL